MLGFFDKKKKKIKKNPMRRCLLVAETIWSEIESSRSGKTTTTYTHNNLFKGFPNSSDF